MRNLAGFILLLATLPVSAQSLAPVVRADLPGIADESSGLAVRHRNSLWTHNDSGGENELYEFDSTGLLTRVLTVSNADNDDWEDVITDVSGHFYIGDFGNNSNKRTNLVIYKLSDPDLIAGSSTLAELIEFSYPDQGSFPPDDPDLNFDVEAFIHQGSNLYLFSKNRSDPYSGHTKLYRLPDSAGTFTAELIDSFYTGTGPWQWSSVTSASLSPDGQRLVLLASGQVWFFSDFTGDDFFGGTAKHYNFSTSLTQKEAICFLSNSELYLSDETVSGTGGKLYYLDISSLVTGKPDVLKDPFLVYPNPFSEGIFIAPEIAAGGLIEIELWTCIGQCVLRESFIPSGFAPYRIPTGDLPKGSYLLLCKNADGAVAKYPLFKGTD